MGEGLCQLLPPKRYVGVRRLSLIHGKRFRQHAQIEFAVLVRDGCLACRDRQGGMSHGGHAQGE